MKTTTKQTAQAPKQPKTIAVSVIAPWFIIAIMSFSIMGVAVGWFFHSSVIAQNTTVAATPSK
jgi:hypothetical protein